MKTDKCLCSVYVHINVFKQDEIICAHFFSSHFLHFILPPIWTITHDSWIFMLCVCNILDEDSNNNQINQVMLEKKNVFEFFSVEWLKLVAFVWLVLFYQQKKKNGKKTTARIGCNSPYLSKISKAFRGTKGKVYSLLSSSFQRAVSFFVRSPAVSLFAQTYKHKYKYKCIRTTTLGLEEFLFTYLIRIEFHIVTHSYSNFVYWLNIYIWWFQCTISKSTTSHIFSFVSFRIPFL